MSALALSAPEINRVKIIHGMPSIHYIARNDRDEPTRAVLDGFDKPRDSFTECLEDIRQATIRRGFLLMQEWQKSRVTDVNFTVKAGVWVVSVTLELTLLNGVQSFTSVPVALEAIDPAPFDRLLSEAADYVAGDRAQRQLSLLSGGLQPLVRATVADPLEEALHDENRV